MIFLSGIIRKLVNMAVNLFVGTVMFLACLYAVYALWDNQHIYHAAQNVQQSMKELKPSSESKDPAAEFAKLKAVNPDVCAWIELDHTKIDYPVLQGADNLTYINTDVYGNFALSGSIFLDSACDPDFEDQYSLIYGHHMEESRMFGDLDLYKEEDFFKQYSAGELIVPKGSCKLKVFACLVVPASEDMIFDVNRWENNSLTELLDYTLSEAIDLRPDVVEEIKNENLRILALSTCASEYTDARTVVMAAML